MSEQPAERLAPQASPPRAHLRLSRPAITLVFTTFGMSAGTWAARLPDLMEQTGISDQQLGILLFMAASGGMAGLILASPFIQRVGPKRAATIVLITYAFVIIPIGMSWNFWSFFAAITLIGFVSGFADVTVNLQGGALENALGKRAISRLYSFDAIGVVLGGIIAWLATWGGVPVPVHFLAIAALIFVSMAWSSRHLLDETGNDSQEKGGFRLPSGPVLIFALIGLLGGLVEGMLFDWATIFVDRRLPDGASHAALGFVAMMAAVVALRWFGDQIIEALGEVTVLLSGAVIAFTALVITLVTGGALSAIIALGFMGFGIALLHPTVMSKGASDRTMPQGMAIASIASFSFFAYLIGAPAFGWLADAFGLERAMLSVLVLIALLMAIILYSRSPRLALWQRPRS